MNGRNRNTGYPPFLLFNLAELITMNYNVNNTIFTGGEKVENFNLQDSEKFTGSYRDCLNYLYFHSIFLFTQLQFFQGRKTSDR